jgi:hypothetical protein
LDSKNPGSPALEVAWDTLEKPPIYGVTKPH